jgi:hypothetical protein
MKRHGPLLTLLAGVLAALVAGTLSVRANSSGDETDVTAVATPPPTSTSAPPAAQSSPPESSSAPAQTAGNVPQRANFAGRTAGREATVAIAIRDGGAIAYVCDGRRAEAWLLGTADAGALRLSGESKATGRLTASYSKKKATGTVWLANKKWSFTVPLVRAPQGLYRADATVGGVRFKGGWIVLPDGQTGVATGADGAAAPAPRLDPATGSATIDGTLVPVSSVSGVAGGWF